VKPLPKRIAKLLLVEPDTLVRRTVAGVARQLALADVHEVSSYESAAELVLNHAFDGLIIAIADDGTGTHLVESIRSGASECAVDCPIVVITALCDVARATSLRDLTVNRVILKPFKVKTVLESIGQLANLDAASTP